MSPGHGRGKEADLIIYVVDGSRELDENDYQIMDFIKERKSVVLLNKSDLEPVVSADEVEEAVQGIR